jgi:hypothetical protein
LTHALSKCVRHRPVNLPFSPSAFPSSWFSLSRLTICWISSSSGTSGLGCYFDFLLLLACCDI